MNKIKEKIT